MKIETKFNVGDYVWVKAAERLEFDADGHECKKIPLAMCFPVIDIQFVFNRGKVQYVLQNMGGVFDESDCFATKEEALAS